VYLIKVLIGMCIHHTFVLIYYTCSTLLPQAREVFRKRGLLFGPHKATLAGSALVSGLELESNPILPGQSLDQRLQDQMAEVYAGITATAKEFNTRGDLHAGAVIKGFKTVADVMLAHGAV
jgi:glutamate dehydrogenase (NADP+)